MRDRTMRSVSLEMNDRLETGRLLERISLSSDGFLRSGVTNECLKSRGKLPLDKERLTIFVMTGIRMDAQSFSKVVGIGSSSHCLLGRGCRRCHIYVSDVSLKVLSDAGGGEGGEWSVVEGISGDESIVVLELSD